VIVTAISKQRQIDSIQYFDGLCSGVVPLWLRPSGIEILHIVTLWGLTSIQDLKIVLKENRNWKNGPNSRYVNTGISNQLKHLKVAKHRVPIEQVGGKHSPRAFLLQNEGEPFGFRKSIQTDCGVKPVGP
jgi:hypothetical protein